MQPYQQRVVTEFDELYVKWAALGRFLGNTTLETLEKLGEEEYNRLNNQYVIMEQYVNILAERINSFKQ
jgi:hypothetical protein